MTQPDAVDTAGQANGPHNAGKSQMEEVKYYFYSTTFSFAVTIVTVTAACTPAG